MIEDDVVLLFWGGFNWLFWIFLVVVIVWAAITIIGKGNNSSVDDRNYSLEILKERNARGEVNQEGMNN